MFDYVVHLSTFIILINCICCSIQIPQQFINGSIVEYRPQKDYIQLSLNHTLLDSSFYSQLNQLHQRRGHQQNLINRGEAHITIITPPEYEVLNKVGLNIGYLNKLMYQFFNDTIQNTPFYVYCLGSSTLPISTRQKVFSITRSTTYFFVLSGHKHNYKPIEPLVKFRYFIKQHYMLLEGDYTTFWPADFHPHITVGFTVRDLFEQDGLIKNAGSCITDVIIK